MEKKDKIPQIRFAGFNEPWEQRKLSKIVNYTKGFAFKSKDYQNEGFRIIRVSDLSKDSVREDVDMIYYNGDNINQYLEYFIKEGEIVVTTVGSKAEMKDSAVGRPLIFNNYKYQLLNQNLVKLEPLNTVNSYFIYSQLLQEKYSAYISSIERGNANQANITITELLKYNIFMPHMKEQVKVAVVFQKLDNLITLHQRKLEKLKTLKKSLLEKMFPKSGYTVPEIRFKNFTDPWEQRKLKDIASFINGRAYSQDELLSIGKYKVLRVGNFYTNDSWYYSDMELGEKYYANYGDLLYTWSATFGPHIWFGDKVIYHYHIWKVELSEQFDKIFAIQILDYDRAKITSDSNGSTMIHITKKGMEEKIFLIPSVREQKNIGEVLEKFDNLITLHQRQFEKLNNIKKSLLEKMFV